MYAEEGKVDFVAIGSSRAESGFDASLFDNIMSKKLGQKVVVYDLSRLWKGRGIDYVTIRDLLEERTVGHIIIEYKYERREYKYGNEIGSPYFKHCARIIDLADSHFKSQPFLPYHERLQKFTKDVLDRMSLSLTCLIKG